MPSQERIKFTISMITYNQEVLIKRALDSVLSQIDNVYKVVISEDCSTDNTWAVIQEYQNRYPNCIKAYHNTKNLGIMLNFEESWKRSEGDVVIQLSGDDELPSGYLNQLSDFIIQNKIDYKNEAFCIYCNYEIRYPNGYNKVVKSNKIIEKGYSPISLKVRNIINARGSVMSIKVMKQFHHICELENVGEFADGVYEIQQQLYSNSNYYIDTTGNIYYARIGVSAKADDKEIIRSYEQGQRLFSKLYNLSEKDVKWLEYSIVQKKLRYHFSLNLLIDNFRLFCISFEPKYGLAGVKLYTGLTLTYRILQNLIHRK